jgi:hypothetical protein
MELIESWEVFTEGATGTESPLSPDGSEILLLVNRGFRPWDVCLLNISFIDLLRSNSGSSLAENTGSSLYVNSLTRFPCSKKPGGLIRSKMGTL